MFELTLKYSNGSTWFAGGFSTMDALNAWADQEKLRPYWDASTELSIVEIKPPIVINDDSDEPGIDNSDDNSEEQP